MGCVHLRTHLTFLNPKHVVQELLGDYHEGLQILLPHEAPAFVTQRPMYAKVDTQAPCLWSKRLDEGYLLSNKIDWQEYWFAVQGHPNWKPKDVIVISDCSHLLLVEVKGIHRAMSHTSVIYFNSLGAHDHMFHPTTSQAAKFLSEVYYLVDHEQTSQSVLSLVKTSYNSPSQVLIAGLQSWHITQDSKDKTLQLQTWTVKVELEPTMGMLKAPVGQSSKPSRLQSWEHQWVSRSWA